MWEPSLSFGGDLLVALVTISTNPPRQLSAAAGASYNRCVDDGLPRGGINSAYRSVAAQEAIFFSRYRVQWTGSGPFGDVKWYQGKRYVRYRGLPVAKPGTSDHNKGNAIDVSVGTVQYEWLMAHGEYHGWYRPLPKSDPVHWVYDVKRDQDRKDKIAARKKVKAAQKAIRVPQSGVNDAATKKAVKAVRAANQSPPTFPYGKMYAQKHSGTKADGRWGPKSVAANTKTVKAFQTAIGATPDGEWGAKTDALWVSVTRKAK